MSENKLLVERADGTYLAVKRVAVFADYVNADGSPRLNEHGAADTGNYAITLSEAELAQFPVETIQGLAQIYDTGFETQDNT